MTQGDLKRIIDFAQDPVFWIFTVAFGLIVSIIGNYLTRFADKVLVSYRRKRMRRVGTREAAIRAAAQHLIRYPNERFDLKLDILFYSQKTVLFSIWCVLLLTMASAYTISVGPFSYYMSKVLVVAGALLWLIVLFFQSQGRVARRILHMYHELSNSKTYKDVLDESLTLVENSSDGSSSR